MEYLKLVSKSLLYVFSIIIVSTIIITIFNNINFFNAKVTSIFKIIIPLVSVFIGGFMIGKKSKNKGWLEGLKFGFIVIVIFILMNLIIFRQKFEFRYLLYYFILLFATIFGSMIGINKRIEETS